MKTATFHYPEHGNGNLVDSESPAYITGYEGDSWKKFSTSKIVNFQWVKSPLNQFHQARLDNLIELQALVNDGVNILAQELGFSSSYAELKDIVEKRTVSPF
jgi:hypothetical protein